METRPARDGGGGAAHSNVKNHIFFNNNKSSPEYIESELVSLNFMFSIAMPLIALVSRRNHVSLCVL